MRRSFCPAADTHIPRKFAPRVAAASREGRGVPAHQGGAGPLRRSPPFKEAASPHPCAGQLPPQPSSADLEALPGRPPHPLPSPELRRPRTRQETGAAAPNARYPPPPRRPPPALPRAPPAAPTCAPRRSPTAEGAPWRPRGGGTASVPGDARRSGPGGCPRLPSPAAVHTLGDPRPRCKPRGWPRGSLRHPPRRPPYPLTASIFLYISPHMSLYVQPSPACLEAAM